MADATLVPLGMRTATLDKPSQAGVLPAQKAGSAAGADQPGATQGTAIKVPAVSAATLLTRVAFVLQTQATSSAAINVAANCTIHACSMDNSNRRDAAKGLSEVNMLEFVISKL
jgi:hypothetical protein